MGWQAGTPPPRTHQVLSLLQEGEADSHPVLIPGHLYGGVGGILLPHPSIYPSHPPWKMQVGVLDLGSLVKQVAFTSSLSTFPEV